MVLVSASITLAKVADGQQGIQGAKGEDGKTSYLHIKYSNDGQTFTENNGETLGAYIGTLVDFTEADSLNFSDYTWKKFTEDVDVGGRNLLLNSKERIVEPKNTGEAVDNYNYARLECEMEMGQQYTISADVEITAGTFTVISVYPYTDGANVAVPIENGRIEHTFTKNNENTVSVLLYAGKSASTRGNGCIFRNIKIEKGNVATDWTPALEEMTTKEEADEIRQTIIDTSTSLTETNEAIILSALQNYVETGNYESFKQTIESQMTLLANQMNLKFTETVAEIERVNGVLQQTNTTLAKYFDFGVNGLTIKANDNPDSTKFRVDNDFAGFYKGEVDEEDLEKNRYTCLDEDSVKTGNLFVDINEVAQFGSYGFIPSDDEDEAVDGLDLVRVGD